MYVLCSLTLRQIVGVAEVGSTHIVKTIEESSPTFDHTQIQEFSTKRELRI